MKKYDAQYPPQPLWLRQLRYLMIAFSVSLLSGLSTLSYADDDTELYASNQLEINPDLGSNILIILDKSGSMKYQLPGEPSPLSGGTTRIAHLTDALLMLLDELQGVNLGFATFSGSTRTSPQRSNVPIIFPISPIGANISSIPSEVDGANNTEVIELAINNNRDDAVQNLSDTSVSVDAPTIFMSHSQGLGIPSSDSSNSNSVPAVTGDEIHTSQRIEDSKDDAHQYDGSVTQNLSNRIWLGRSSRDSKGIGHAAFRFKNLGIPKGSTIVEAKLKVTANDNHQSVPIKLNIKAVNLDNPPQFKSNSNYIKSLPTFSNTTTWTVTETWTNNNKYTTSNFSNVLQQVVNASYWDDDDAVILVFSGDPSLNTGDNRNIEKGKDGLTELMVTYIEADPDASSATSITTITEIVDAADHSKEYLSPNEQRGKIGSNDALWLGNQYIDHEKRSTLLGFRFENIQVPLNATITNAYISINLDQENERHTDDALKIDIMGEDTPYAEPYRHDDDNDYDLSRRKLKTTVIEWEVKNGREEETVSSPDLSELISQYVSDHNWRLDNNAISLMLKANSSDTEGMRGVCGVLNSCYSSHDNLAPQLVIEWEGGDPMPDTNYTVGLRFQGVNIPQGANIERAYLEFPANADENNTASYIISAAKAGDEAGFIPENNNLGARQRLSTTVNWNDVPGWTQGNRYQSVELKPLIQAMINQGNIGPNTDGWCGGRDMVFFIETSTSNPGSLRKFSSYDGNSENPVKLHIEYGTNTISNDACVTRTQPYQITSSGNDGEETTIKAGSPSDSIFLTDHPLEMTTTSNDNTTRLSAYRFTGLDIAPTTNIIKAELIFTASHADDENTNLIIYGEKGNAPAFSDAGGDFSQRISTNATVRWTPEPWERDQRYGVDVTDIVRENLQSNWNTGNSMAFFVTGTGLRRAYAFDREPNNAALLKITFTGRYQDHLPKVRDRLKELVIEHTRSEALGGWTPLVPALYEGVQYYMGNSIYGGDYRGVDPGYSEYKGDRDNAVSHRGSFSGGLIYNPPNCTNENPYDYACREQVICTGENITVKNGAYNPHNICNSKSFNRPARYIQPPVSACTANHMVLFTDGEATSKDPYINDQIRTMSGKQCNNRSNDTEDCGIELVDYLHNTDINNELPGLQNVITHTIGFALDDVEGSNYLQELASAGGGNFYEASNAQSILTAFREIVRLVRTTSSSFAAPTLSINAFNRLFHNDDIYFALFAPSEFALWNGNIKKYKLCINGRQCSLGSVLDKNNESAIGANDKIKETAFDLWNTSDVADGTTIALGGAGEMIPAPGSRVIYTNSSPSGSSPILNTVLSGISNSIPLPPADNNAISNSSLNVSNAADRAKVFNWIYGYKNGTPTGNPDGNNLREWRFGDPLHSSPAAITYSANQTRVFIAGNDGMIRSLDGQTGVEQWAFIPYEMLGLQKQLLDGDKYPPKAYGIDGTPTFLVKDNNSNGTVDAGESVNLFIGARRGGRYLYGLDVTDDVPTLMWAINAETTAGYGKLGQTWSAPIPTTIRMGNTDKTVLIYGGGYDQRYDLRQNYPEVANPSTDESQRIGNAIFISDAQTGELLWWVGNQESGASMELSDMRYPIPSNIGIYDSNGDGLTDRLYVGDLGGQVWRIDLGTDIGLNSRGSSLGARLAMVADPSTSTHHRHFYYAPDIVQLQDSEYSMEPQYDLILITSGFRANPIGTYIQDRFYAIRDRAIHGLIPADSNSGNLGDAKLDTPEDMPTGTIANDSKFFTLEHSVDYGGTGNYEAFFDATDNVLQVGSAAAKEEAKIAMRKKHGFFVDLVDRGEKGLSSPIVLSGKVFFTTFVPPGSNNSGSRGNDSDNSSSSSDSDHSDNDSDHSDDDSDHSDDSDDFDEHDIDDPDSEFNSDTGDGRDPDSNDDCNYPLKKNKICHYTPSNESEVQIICVSNASLSAHYRNHNDVDFDESTESCPSFTQASMANACSNDIQEGSGKLYSLDILTGAAASNLNPDNDRSNNRNTDEDGTKDSSDRSEQLGGGIPSSALPVFLPEGISIVVGTGGGLHNLDEILPIPKQQVYWIQE